MNTNKFYDDMPTLNIVTMVKGVSLRLIHSIINGKYFAVARRGRRKGLICVWQLYTIRISVGFILSTPENNPIISTNLYNKGYKNTKEKAYRKTWADLEGGWGRGSGPPPPTDKSQKYRVS